MNEQEIKLLKEAKEFLNTADNRCLNKKMFSTRARIVGANNKIADVVALLKEPCKPKQPVFDMEKAKEVLDMCKLVKSCTVKDAYKQALDEIERLKKESGQNEKMALRYYSALAKLKVRLGVDDPWHNVEDTKLIEQLQADIERYKAASHGDSAIAIITDLDAKVEQLEDALKGKHIRRSQEYHRLWGAEKQLQAEVERLNGEVDAGRSLWIDAQNARKRLALENDSLKAELKISQDNAHELQQCYDEMLPLCKKAEQFQAELAKLKNKPKAKPNTKRIINKYTAGVRCGHCGLRSKVGEVWLISGRDWISSSPICYGHKACVEKAIKEAENIKLKGK